MKTHVFDAVIVGAGGAGLVAPLYASPGANVAEKRSTRVLGS